jgi:hypothetical protein
MRNVWITAAMAVLCAAGIAVAADTKEKEKAKPAAAPAKSTTPAATTAPKPTDKANEKGIILQNQGAKGSDKAIILQNQGAKAPAADAAKKSTKAATPQ